MRRGVIVLLALALLVGITAGAADAWVRSKMFDGVAPLDPLQPNAGFLGWDTFDDLEWEGEVDVLPGEIAGPVSPTEDLRVAYALAFGNNSKLKYRTDHGPWAFDNTRKTSILWSFYIAGDSVAKKCPQVYLRMSSGDLKISYTNVSGPEPRGWYVDTGTVDPQSGAVLIGDRNKYGIPMEPEQWHTMKLTFDPATNKWDLWFDGGSAGHIWGTGGGSIGSYLQWPRIDRSSERCKFWTEYFYWGQGDAETTDGISTPTVNGQSTYSSSPTPMVSGTSATIAWNSDVPGTSKIVWDKKFHGLANTVTVPGSATNSHSYTITDLEPSATYTFYVETTDGVNTWASGLKQFRTETMVSSTLGNTGFEEGAEIYPWVSCVPPSGEGIQRWGGNFWQWNLDQFAWFDSDKNEWVYTAVAPRSEGGRMWSGSVCGSYSGRDYAALRQQVSVTPGQIYKATVQFYGNFSTTDPNANLAEAAGRVGLDPTGGTDPGHLEGIYWQDNPDVYWGPWTFRPDPGAGWQTATAIAIAESDVMTVYLQQHYNAHPTVWLAFDDVVFEESDIILPETCAQTKKWIPGFVVTLKNVVLHHRMDNPDGTVVGYVEDADRSGGIRVWASDSDKFPFEIWPPMEVDVTGTLQVNADQELEIKINSITPSLSPTGATISALACSNKALGGGRLSEQVGVEGGVGTNNVGLLVRTWGKVTAVVQDIYDFSVFIDDGSGMTGGAYGVEYAGVEVKIPYYTGFYADQFQVGSSYVLASGVCSLKMFDPDNSSSTDNSVVKPVILVRENYDINLSQF